MEQKVYYYNPDTKQLSFRANPALTEKLESLSAKRHRSKSNTIRMLISMGLEQYETNELAGRTKAKDAREYAERERFIAENLAEARELNKGKPRGKQTELRPAILAGSPLAKWLFSD